MMVHFVKWIAMHCCIVVLWTLTPKSLSVRLWKWLCPCLIKIRKTTLFFHKIVFLINYTFSTADTCSLVPSTQNCLVWFRNVYIRPLFHSFVHPRCHPHNPNTLQVTSLGEQRWACYDFKYHYQFYEEMPEYCEGSIGCWRWTPYESNSKVWCGW